MLTPDTLPFQSPTNRLFATNDQLYSNERVKKNKRVSNIGIIIMRTTTQMEHLQKQVSDLMIQHCVYCHVTSFKGRWRRRRKPPVQSFEGCSCRG